MFYAKTNMSDRCRSPSAPAPRYDCTSRSGNGGPALWGVRGWSAGVFGGSAVEEDFRTEPKPRLWLASGRAYTIRTYYVYTRIIRDLITVVCFLARAIPATRQSGDSTGRDSRGTFLRVPVVPFHGVRARIQFFRSLYAFLAVLRYTHCARHVIVIIRSCAPKDQQRHIPTTGGRVRGGGGISPRKIMRNKRTNEIVKLAKNHYVHYCTLIINT